MTNVQKRVLSLSWITYAIFYFLRVHFSIAIPGMLEEYGYTKIIFGGALSAFFALYAAGQFISGQLADNIGAKRLIGIGLFASIIISLLVPSLSRIIALITIVWGLNGSLPVNGLVSEC